MYEMIETFMRNRPIFHLGHIVQDLMQKRDSGPTHK
jgi:hypothetical protein